MDRPEAGGELRAIDLLFAFSLAADLSVGLTAGHGVRASYIGMRLAEILGLSAEQRTDLFYAELLMDAGCTAWTSQMAAMFLGDEIVGRRQLFFLSDFHDPRDLLKWLARYMATGQGLTTRARQIANFGVNGSQFMVEGLRNTAETAARLAGRLGRPPGTQEALHYVFEQWDGSGPRGRRGEEIPLTSRIVYTTIFLEVFHQEQGREGAIRLASARRGKTLDPTVVDAFLQIAADESFWQGLEAESVWDTVRRLEPDSPSRYLSASRLDDACRAFADFADLKSFYSAGHSRRVAELAERVAAQLGRPPDERTAVRRAALLHDIGLVAVPSFVLHKPEERLSAAEWESLRLHPYHTERILSRFPPFVPLIPLAAAHHERLDGRGYYRGLDAPRIPLGARVVAVADRFDELTHAGPGRAALEPAAALARLRRDTGGALDGDVVATLATVLDQPAPAADHAGSAGEPKSGPERDWPAGLTDREVEVLRALATGASRRDMAHRLFVSEHTIRHHLEHIYRKIDAHTRVAATLFAIEHDLLAE